MIYLGSDHAGYTLKQEIKKHLESTGKKFVDLGVFAVDPPVDYPEIAREVSEKVSENKGSAGILICGTGTGMCMAANKMPGIRGAACESAQTVEMARRHNDANVLCLGGRVLTTETANSFVDIFIATPFEAEERHVRRVNKIEK